MGIINWWKRKRELSKISPEMREAVDRINRDYGFMADIVMAHKIIGEETNRYLIECNWCEKTLQIPKDGLKQEEHNRYALTNPIYCECGREIEAIYYPK